jgi:hypothetical protein
MVKETGKVDWKAVERAGEEFYERTRRYQDGVKHG